jgi:UDP-GlcNAc:undecaprenyl-phosphate GlcNAc-1-phosphate transferase
MGVAVIPPPLALAVIAGTGAAVLSAVGTPLVIRLAGWVGLIDAPRTGKIHLRPTPTAGGFAVGLAFFVSLWGVRAWIERGPDHDLTGLAGLTLAGGLLLALGLYDDSRGADVWLKLAVQIPVGLIVYLAGFRVERLTNPFGADLVLGAASLPLTLLWVVAIINALNLIDGLDGLATGVGVIAALALAVVGLVRGETLVLVLAAILAGSLAGFLPYNFPPARIFLGDTGSLIVGLLLAALGLVENRKATLALALVVPIVAMLIPILDTLLAIARRVRNGRHPFRGDTLHVHHRLLGIGLTQRQAVLLMWATSGYFGGLAVILSVLPKRQVVWAALLVGGGVYAALRWLRWLERRAATSGAAASQRSQTPGPLAG